MALLTKPSGIWLVGEQRAGTDPGRRETVPREAWLVSRRSCSSPVLWEYWASRGHPVPLDDSFTLHLSPMCACLIPSVQQQISPCAF